jgi:hypothetical protein
VYPRRAGLLTQDSAPQTSTQFFPDFRGVGGRISDHLRGSAHSQKLLKLQIAPDDSVTREEASPAHEWLPRIATLPDRDATIWSQPRIGPGVGNGELARIVACKGVVREIRAAPCSRRSHAAQLRLAKASAASSVNPNRHDRRLHAAGVCDPQARYRMLPHVSRARRASDAFIVLVTCRRIAPRQPTLQQCRSCMRRSRRRGRQCEPWCFSTPGARQTRCGEWGVRSVPNSPRFEPSSRPAICKLPEGLQALPPRKCCCLPGAPMCTRAHAHGRASDPGQSLKRHGSDGPGLAHACNSVDKVQRPGRVPITIDAGV